MCTSSSAGNNIGIVKGEMIVTQNFIDGSSYAIKWAIEGQTGDEKVNQQPIKGQGQPEGQSTGEHEQRRRSSSGPDEE